MRPELIAGIGLDPSMGKISQIWCPDGQHVLRLENFMVTNGPDLHVLLVPHPEPQTRDDVEGYLDLGSLKGNVGNQNYEIPADVDLSQYGSALIFCVPFHVIFASASLN